MLLESVAFTAVKPVLAAAGVTYLLDRAGFDLTAIPPISGFIAEEGDSDELGARYFCCFGRRRKKPTAKDSENPSGIAYVIPTIVCGLGVFDILMGGVLLQSLYLPIDQPLKRWVIGSLLLGFPTTVLVHNVSKKVSFHHAFLVEAAATVVGFAWLSYGMLIISKSTAF